MTDACAALCSGDVRYLTWAVIIGGLSAVSLPLGSLLGIFTRPRPVLVGLLAAFGAGALLAALAIELVAPTVNAVIAPGADLHIRHAFFALLGGSAAGGILFVVLDQLVNAHGGFLRKYSTTVTYLTRSRRRKEAEIVRALARVKLLTALPPEAIRRLVDLLFPVSFTSREVLFAQESSGDRLFFIDTGTVELSRNGELFATLGPGDVLGEIALLTGAPRTATATAAAPVTAYILRREDFARLCRDFPELDAAARQLAADRLGELTVHDTTRAATAARWAKRATRALQRGEHVPDRHEISRARAAYSSAPLAIWLGILLDGIPESFVIGSGFLALVAVQQAAGIAPEFLSVIPYTLIAGLFLSNFPEALSSSVGMRLFGMRGSHIFLLWFSLMVVTAAGAGVGYACGDRFGHVAVVGIEGMAAGAMLTMIAATMLPEAVHRAGANGAGLSTLVGFLSAIAFKLLE